MAGHVLEKAEAGADFIDDSRDVGPEVSRVFLAEHLSGVGEWLARVSASDEIHFATPRTAVEGFKVRPNRSLIQGSFLHAANNCRRRIRFPLHVTDGFCPRQGHSDADIEAAHSRAEGDGRYSRGTYSHVT
jgi:hypothetical protein